MTREEGLAWLRERSHAVVTPEKAREVARAFGAPESCVPVRVLTDTRSQFKGLTLRGKKEGDTEEAVEAVDLACCICDALSLEYDIYHGRGSQMDDYVRALQG